MIYLNSFFWVGVKGEHNRHRLAHLSAKYISISINNHGCFPPFFLDIMYQLHIPIWIVW